MKRHILSLLTLAASTCLTGLLAASSLAQTNPKFAQQLLTQVFNSRCNRATEVSYRSNRLTTQQTNGTTVHVNAILRKIVTPGSPLRDSDPENGCRADARETSQQELVIQSPTETRLITLTPYDCSYLTNHLQSFSPNGQYLVADLQSVYAGGDAGNHITIFNLGDNISATTPEVCTEVEFASFYGFATPTEAIVRCEGYLASSQTYEAVNVRTGNVRRLAGTPSVMNYGLPAGEPAVTKIQTFQ